MDANLLLNHVCEQHFQYGIQETGIIMQIYPAIDLHKGCCVRLYQGKFDEETIYSDNPLIIADEFEELGASWVHIVDLDAARDPLCCQKQIIDNLIDKTNINVQIGGGIREIGQIHELLKRGVERVVVGSQAVSDPAVVKSWFKEIGSQHLVLAVDVKYKDDGLPYVAVQGWQETSNRTLFDLLTDFQSVNLQHVLCTDVARNGTLQGPNLALYESILSAFPDIQLQAAGGIATVEDIKQLADINVSGVVIGRALYEEKIMLSDVIIKNI